LTVIPMALITEFPIAITRSRFRVVLPLLLRFFVFGRSPLILCTLHVDRLSASRTKNSVVYAFGPRCRGASAGDGPNVDHGVCITPSHTKCTVDLIRPGAHPPAETIVKNSRLSGGHRQHPRADLSGSYAMVPATVAACPEREKLTGCRLKYNTGARLIQVESRERRVPNAAAKGPRVRKACMLCRSVPTAQIDSKMVSEARAVEIPFAKEAAFTTRLDRRATCGRIHDQQTRRRSSSDQPTGPRPGGGVPPGNTLSCPCAFRHNGAGRLTVLCV